MLLIPIQALPIIMNDKKDNIRTLRPSSKFEYKKLGPFTIEAKLNYDNYRLKLPERMKIHPIFHVSLLEKTESSETTENLEAYDEQEYEAEKVIDKRLKKGEVEYLINWKGYESSDNSWEKVTNLFCPEKIQEFESTKKKHQK
jgi:chromodomain-containing protein